MLGRFHRPGQHGIWDDFEAPRRGADTQTLGKTGQDPHDQLDLRLFTVQEHATGLQKVATARRIVELTPGSTTGMTVSAQIAKPQPTPEVTARMRTKVL